MKFTAEFPNAPAAAKESIAKWGDYPKTTSSNQQYWVGAIVQELKSEGKVERVSESGPWRLL